jgi:hypothetical protein
VLGLPHLVGMALITTGLSGCALLDLLLGQSPFPDPDESFGPFPFASAETTFTTGSATIVLSGEGGEPGETLVLDELAGGGSLLEDFGLQARWTNGDGWYLSFQSYPDFGFPAESASLSIDRIFDGQHWTIYDQTRCVTTTERSDGTGIAGSATCRGLEWSDFFSSSSGLGFPDEIEGEPPFDAEITFEAH